MNTTHKYVAVDPTNGRHLRTATAAEVTAYHAGNVRSGVQAARCFDRPVMVGAVLVDLHTGPGASHTPGRFL